MRRDRGPGSARSVIAGLFLLVVACADADVPTDRAAEDERPTAAPDAAEAPDTGEAPDGGDTPDTGAASEAADEPEPVLSLVATVAPIADLVAMVGGDRVEVHSLVPPGADSHTYEPRPGDVAVLSEADAYLGIGLGLNDAALRLAEEALGASAPVVRLGELALSDPHLVFDHGHDHDHDHGHDHGDGDDRLGPNPHVWTSLRNAGRLVDQIAEVLTGLDPDGAEQYGANAAAARTRIETLDRRAAEAIATIPARNRTLVAYHDAWSYLARDHDLVFAVAIQPASYADPSAAEVRAVIELIRELDVPAVFGSEVFPSSVLVAIAEETGARYVGDLADDVLPGEPGDPDHDYVGMMRRNLVTIVEALGGDASGLGPSS